MRVLPRLGCHRNACFPALISKTSRQDGLFTIGKAVSQQLVYFNPALCKQKCASVLYLNPRGLKCPARWSCPISVGRLCRRACRGEILPADPTLSSFAKFLPSLGVAAGEGDHLSPFLCCEAVVPMQEAAEQRGAPRAAGVCSDKAGCFPLSPRRPAYLGA